MKVARGIEESQDKRLFPDDAVPMTHWHDSVWGKMSYEDSPCAKAQWGRDYRGTSEEIHLFGGGQLIFPLPKLAIVDAGVLAILAMVTGAIFSAFLFTC
ncbi:MAG: hypothetical protein AAB853_02910 [Patescibacteria group bacterium]